MKEKIKKIYRKILPGYEEELLKEIRGMKNILDLGCGSNSPLRLLKTPALKVGVDIFENDISISKQKKIHDKYYCKNVLNINEIFSKKSFDCVIALDVIEHLTKEEGFDLIKKMEFIARTKVIIFTPNGFIPKKREYNPYQEHKSGWTTDDFKKMNYTIKGINGLKYLRKDEEILIKPLYLGLFISDITHLVTKKIPEHSHQLLCIKKILK